MKDLLDNISPEVYQNLKRAVELGKWSTGVKISSEQRDLCMQAIIVYEKKNLPPDQHTGYIEAKKHTHCGSEKGEVVMGDTQPLNFK